MLKNIRPRHDAFEDHVNLYNFISIAIPGTIMEFVDPIIQLENNLRNKINISWYIEHWSGLYKGIPRDLMSITNVVTILHRIRASLK